MALLLAETSEDDIIVATTGHIARELYAYRESRGESHDADFCVLVEWGMLHQWHSLLQFKSRTRELFV